MLPLNLDRRKGPRARKNHATVVSDAFGSAGDMQKDRGYSALVETGGKRILFDTGNDPVIFANNLKARGVEARVLGVMRAVSILAEVQHVSCGSFASVDTCLRLVGS